MQQVITDKTFPVLPSSVTALSIREASLPVRVLAMEKAIAECTDPYLLKPMSDVAKAIATAARILKKELPEQHRALNVVAKNSEIRLGELLQEYSNYCVPLGGSRGARPSPRMETAKDIGLGRDEARTLVRISQSAEAAKEKFRESELCAKTFLNKHSSELARQTDYHGNHNIKGLKPAFSSTLRAIMSERGLSQALSCLRAAAKGAFGSLAPDEKALVSGILTACEREIELMREALNARSK